MAAAVGHMPNVKMPKNRRSLSTNPVDTWDAVEKTMSNLELITNSLNNGNYDNILLLNLTVLMSSLPQYGPLIEEAYQGQLDRAFKIFRDACRDEHLNQNCRVKLMALIERRAMNWQKSDSFEQYYKNKIPSPECEVQPIRVDQFQGAHTALPAMLTPTVPLLGPGEQIKSSGRFPQPTRVPGKNYFKDEVVINNADSGKVMGIKGRRVHMIEELSETIISFQRVTPGVKERLVQITGPNEVRINEAIQLMGDTIRRNASPVPFRVDQPDLGSSSSVNSSASEESNRIQTGHHHHSNHRLQHSFSTNDTSPEYKHTVTVGPHTIKLTGTNYDLVTESKIILERHFGDRDLFFLEDQSVPDDVNKMMPMDLKQTVQSPTTLYRDGAKAVAELAEANGKPLDLNGRHGLPSYSLPHTQEKVIEAPMMDRCYRRETMLAIASSKFSKMKPDNWDSVCPAFLIKVQRKPVTRTVSDPQVRPISLELPRHSPLTAATPISKPERRVSFDPRRFEMDKRSDVDNSSPSPVFSDPFEPITSPSRSTPTSLEYNPPPSESPSTRNVTSPQTTIPYRPNFKFSRKLSSPEISATDPVAFIPLRHSISVQSPSQDAADSGMENPNPKETISFRPQLTNPKLGFLRKPTSP